MVERFLFFFTVKTHFHILRHILIYIILIRFDIRICINACYQLKNQSIYMKDLMSYFLISHVFPLGPLRQTFTHNPLQQTPPIAAASTKNKATDSKERPWKDTIG